MKTDFYFPCVLLPQTLDNLLGSVESREVET